MIEKISVRNWQSLRSVDLTLGRLTVIVGSSSSGKTALMRALRAVASNVRGAGMITRGAKMAAITVHTGEHAVTLERTETGGRYRIVDAVGREREYTKLAGGVPEAVTAALRINPVPTGGVSLNFAGQFDRPYLLDDSGATVALVLGDLTNVATILAAVAEANRRKRAHTATLKTRQHDLAALTDRIGAFGDLPTQLATCARAETIAEHAAQLDDRVARFRASTETLVIAEGVLARATLPDIPTDTAVTAAQTRLHRLRTLLDTLTTTTEDLAGADHDAQQWAIAEDGLHEQVHRTLVTAGTCPTCGQSVTAPDPAALGPV